MSRSHFPVHTIATAPEASKPVLDEVGRKYGFLPNLMGVFASAPAALQAYLGLSAQFAKTSLSPEGREVVLLTAARANECGYCVAVHSTTAAMAKVASGVVESIRDDRPIADPKLEALRRLTSAFVTKRGWLTDADLEQFLSAGYQPVHVLEVLVGVTLKTLSNYTNHIADTPLDAAFAPKHWDRPAR